MPTRIYAHVNIPHPNIRPCEYTHTNSGDDNEDIGDHDTGHEWAAALYFCGANLKICNCLCSYLITVLISNLVRRASYLCQDFKKVRSPTTGLVGCFLITFDIHFSDTLFVFAKLCSNISPPVCILKFAFINYILERLRYIYKKVCLSMFEWLLDKSFVLPSLL